MKSMIITAGALLLGATLAAGGGKAAGKPEAVSQRPSWRVPKGDPMRGALLGQSCMACHSKGAAGGGMDAPKLGGQRDSYLFFALLDYRSGRRKHAVMSPMAASLSVRDARDLAAYFAGEFPDHAPAKANTGHPAYRITSTTCTWCHGETGLGEYEGSPVLTGQNPAYLVMALAQYRSGERSDPTMRDIARRYTPEDYQALADYFSAYGWVEYK